MLVDDPKKAYFKMLSMLARRDHSELEIRKKLGRRYGPLAIEEALVRIKELGYLRNPEDLAQAVLQNLRRRGKGILFIQNALREKGLPLISFADQEQNEIDEAREVLEKRFGSPVNEPKLRQQAFRFLVSRGFTMLTARKVLHEES